MEEQIDWDALTFSFTPTDTMYVAKCKLGEEWRTGELRDLNSSSNPDDIEGIEITLLGEE